MTTITGRAAIEYARDHGLTLSKYADPTEEAREGLSVSEAEDVASEDPGLIHVETGSAITFELDNLAGDDPAKMQIRATIHERGNGLPDVGDYVAGDDGEVYRVVALTDRIRPGRPGVSDSIDGLVELADWDDVTDDDEPTCLAHLGRAVTSGGGR